MFRFSLPGSVAMIVALAGCALDPSAPHPLVARATADAPKSALPEDAVVTVPTAVIMRGGKVVAANVRAARVWPTAVVQPSEEVDAPITVAIAPDDVEIQRGPAQEPATPAPSLDMADYEPVPAMVLAPEESVLDGPDYVAVPAIPDEPVLPVYEAAPLFEPAPPQVPAQLSYGASL